MKTKVITIFAALLTSAAQADPGMALPTPEAARSVLINAISAKDKGALLQLLGSEAGTIVNSGDPTYDDFILGRLADGIEKQCSIDRWDDDTVFFNIGPNSWQMPIPLLKTDGGWAFNVGHDKDQILLKRIRRNEANAVEVCRAYVNAQRIYSQKDVNGDGAREYAQKIISDDGKRNGLYWPQVRPTDSTSPLGPLFGKARERGYLPPAAGEEIVYQGYAYRILTSQVDPAKDGATNYIVDGRLTGGFGLVCWPAKWGTSGKRMFLVNQDGRVWQKDLGPQTGDLQKQMTTYNPDSSWQPANL
jgi:hypothetical protein